MDTPTSTSELRKIVEAVLFAAGHPVSYEKFARLFDMQPRAVKKFIREFSEDFNTSEEPRGVMLLAYDDACQLCTREEYAPYIREALNIRRGGNLSNSSIETLAIIAYNQPATRAYVDLIRGVDSSYAVNSLCDRELIEACGRLDAPGRPVLYRTTENFLRCFGIRSLADLPPMGEEAMDLLSQLQKDGALTGEESEASPDTEEAAPGDDGGGEEPQADAPEEGESRIATGGENENEI